jgi:hypothetical protein
MAEFNEKYGIILSEEDKEILKMCASASGNKEITIIPNLQQAISESFEGWEVKQYDKMDTK